MEVLLGPMRPSVAGGRVYVPAERRRDETNDQRKEKLFFGKGGIIIIGRRREETYRLRRTHTHSLSLYLEMMMSERRELSILGLVAGRYTEFFFRRSGKSLPGSER